MTVQTIEAMMPEDVARDSMVFEESGIIKMKNMRCGIGKVPYRDFCIELKAAGFSVTSKQIYVGGGFSRWEEISE